MLLTPSLFLPRVREGKCPSHLLIRAPEGNTGAAGGGQGRPGGAAGGQATHAPASTRRPALLAARTARARGARTRGGRTRPGRGLWLAEASRGADRVAGPPGVGLRGRKLRQGRETRPASRMVTRKRTTHLGVGGPEAGTARCSWEVPPTPAPQVPPRPSLTEAPRELPAAGRGRGGDGQGARQEQQQQQRERRPHPRGPSGAQSMAAGARTERGGDGSSRRVSPRSCGGAGPSFSTGQRRQPRPGPAPAGPAPPRPHIRPPATPQATPSSPRPRPLPATRGGRWR